MSLSVNGVGMSGLANRLDLLFAQSVKLLIGIGERNVQKIEERWKDIPMFEGIFQISDFGRLKSFKKSPNGRILSNINRKGGYLSVVLKFGVATKYTRIHRLVAELFIPNPNNKPAINHRDSNKQHNWYGNLEWVTYSENIRHAIKYNPKIIQGMNNYNIFIRPKTIQQFTQSGELLTEYFNAREASKGTGVCRRNILQVANKDEYKPGMTRRQAGGFVWKFKEETL